MYKVLIVEDDNDINSLLNDLLKNEYETISAFSGTEAIRIFEQEENNLDLILLDLMLPGKNGEQVIEYIRKSSQIPIIVLTAKGDTNTLVSVLEIGADDYIPKPFDVREVKARVKSHLRKKIETLPNTNQKEEILKYEDILINITSRELFINGSLVNLRQKEFDMLVLFVSEPKRVFTKKMLYTLVWDDAYYGDDNTINVHISRLRAKLKEYTDKEYIDTVWGVGFRLNSNK